MFGVNKKGYGVDNPHFHSIVKPALDDIFPFGKEYVDAGEITLSKRDFPYRDKRILILGGGGSTSRLLPQIDFDSYDYVWSLNNFYKNDWIRSNVRVDLFSVGPEVDLQDQLLVEYLQKNSTTAAFELHEKWTRKGINPSSGKTHEELKLEVQKCFSGVPKIGFQTKYYSQLGGGARLLIFAGAIGVKDVDITGYDGPNAIKAKDHAFEVGKGSFSQFCTPMTQEQRIAFFQDAYDFFWVYLQRFGIKVNTLEYNPIHRKLYEISSSGM